MTAVRDHSGRRRGGQLWAALAAFALAAAAVAPAPSIAAEGETPRVVDYARVRAGPAPKSQSAAAAHAKSDGCLTCHTATDAPTMHQSESVVLGCVDCHGGDAGVRLGAGLRPGEPGYRAAQDAAHVQPTYPKSWNYPHSANPQHAFTLLNRESPEFVRFVNPSDYRIVRESCGACHLETIHAAERSMMATGVMLWGGASYNNGILPYKNYLLGEAYTRDGQPAKLLSPGNPPGTVTPQQAARGALPMLNPLPTWQVLPPGDNFRVFERGGRNIVTQFPEIGLPNAAGAIQRLEEPGRPDIRQSNRGPGTGLRVAIPVLNIHKTRLNDPFMWFMGTNDQPGDYRTSGCAACHVPYANDREPRHGLIYAQYGRDGETVTADPTIPRNEPGHPLRHAFTRAIPTSQCMNCHMHQPNMFLNTYLGYTMWDYESDAPLMWPNKDNPFSDFDAGDGHGKTVRVSTKTQMYPSSAHIRAVNERNPEAAAARGLWGFVDFLRTVYDNVNPRAKETQFADYHGHGWNFRAIFKRDRKGNLLDADGAVVANDDPEKFRRKSEPLFAPVGTNPGKAVHMMSIHAEVGMQCADCHFAQDSHGNGLIHGEVASAVEIGCKDCHGTADALPTLRTSGPAARPAGADLSVLRNPDGKRRFEWVTREGRRVLVQRSIVDPALEWTVSLVKESVNPDSPGYNAKAARSKLMSQIDDASGTYRWGLDVGGADRAHKDDDLACYTCHLSWTTSCGGCHLPIEANWKSEVNHYDGETTRNFATYNPQVAREDMFQLGRHQTTKGAIIAPVRSSSALILSSTNINRERIYVQQPPISAAGFSSQAFAPHYPHTERKTETKTCTDCHLSADGDNNAIMSQLMLLGTNFVNFVGLHAYVGQDRQIEAVRVTEWEEPQAVFGSYLHRYAYPDFYRQHTEANGRELKNWVRGGQFGWAESVFRDQVDPPEEISNPTQSAGGAVNCIQLRGEYLYTAEGPGGFRVYDVASIANKGVSDRILSAPFAPLGQDTHVRTTDATCMALPTNQPIAPARNTPQIQRDNQEQPFHPLYSYAVVTDAVEGLILVDVNAMADREPANNFLRRAVTWNEGGVLNGARHVTLAGHIAYVAAAAGIVVVDLNDPLRPRHSATVPLADVRASAAQFRYLFVTTGAGLQTLDITRLEVPQVVAGALAPLRDARKLYVARTYAYVAAGAEGLVIVDVEKPEAPRVHQRVTLDGRLNDARDVVVGSTHASLFAYVADGRNGVKVLQLTSPSSQPNYYGFSPEPRPELIAWRRTDRPALSLSKGIDRDRAVDETGHQIAVFGRLGSRPFNRREMEMFFRTRGGQPFYVTDRFERGQTRQSAARR
ncbi:MAG: hypothetical protein NW200_06290 [Hyphomonadaceae bacterium]|nr:hypothetical protein [Hyphomonadaceae bacterium]